MSAEGISITEAAQVLGVSTRTVRRFIKAGKLPARKVPGPFGDEYRMAPEDVSRVKEGGIVLSSADDETEAVVIEEPAGAEKSTAEIPEGFSKQNPASTVEVMAPHGDLMKLVRELEEKNLGLAAQLGAAGERIRSLENQMKLLTAAKRPWWRRILGLKN